MINLKSFDDWKIDENTPFGTGASRKYWLNKENEKGIFKFPKVSNFKITGEYWAEYLASKIATLIEIPCAKIDIGTYKGDIGSLSYFILNRNETLEEGATFITRKYLDYDINTFYSQEAKEWYTLNMIKSSLSEFNLFSDFIKIPIFDCLIGNTDRHHSNWAIVLKDNEVKGLSPLYDNGSSLCSIENEEKINLDDKNWFNSRIYSKSKSMIRIKNEKKRPTHFEVFDYIFENYFD